mmetsp:Transcript_41648/g.89421  ORF Transcript_41648/g.89421 Transcript_41648/m.89421 type:complete len:133 (+) Transcript_41648:38-436(+)
MMMIDGGSFGGNDVSDVCKSLSSWTDTPTVWQSANLEETAKTVCICSKQASEQMKAQRHKVSVRAGEVEKLSWVLGTRSLRLHHCPFECTPVCRMETSSSIILLQVSATVQEPELGDVLPSHQAAGGQPREK